jgi:hypothetical protein
VPPLELSSKMSCRQRAREWGVALKQGERHPGAMRGGVCRRPDPQFPSLGPSPCTGAAMRATRLLRASPPRVRPHLACALGKAHHRMALGLEHLLEVGQQAGGALQRELHLGDQHHVDDAWGRGQGSRHWLGGLSRLGPCNLGLHRMHQRHVHKTEASWWRARGWGAGTRCGTAPAETVAGAATLVPAAAGPPFTPAASRRHPFPPDAIDACIAMKPDCRPMSLTKPMPFRAEDASTWREERAWDGASMCVCVCVCVCLGGCAQPPLEGAAAGPLAGTAVHKHGIGSEVAPLCTGYNGLGAPDLAALDGGRASLRRPWPWPLPKNPLSPPAARAAPPPRPCRSQSTCR